jgi:hypothetical protein
MHPRLLVDPDDLEYVCELGQGALSLVEKARARIDGQVCLAAARLAATPAD